MRYLGRNGGIEGARPLRVVVVGAEYLAAYLPAGTPIVRPSLADGRPLRAVPLAEQLLGARSTAPDIWGGAGTLKLVPLDGSHSIWLFWHEGGEFWGWYVNLEERHRWHDRGMDTRDHVLDICVDPDRSWEWKDEGELAAAVELGAVDSMLAREIRAEGERVAALIEAWAPPFCDGWEEWRPHPAWPLPQLPEDWNRRL